MNLEWLKANVRGFKQLPQIDYEEATSFFWLWSIFEANLLNKDANVPLIRKLVKGWQDNGLLDFAPFAPSLTYFRSRYFRNGVFTESFGHLNLDYNGVSTKEYVKSVLGNEAANNRDAMIVLLIIVYRFRNNLFHGPKWQYELQGQLENFRHANTILRRAMEMDGRGLLKKHA